MNRAQPKMPGAARRPQTGGCRPFTDGEVLSIRKAVWQHPYTPREACLVELLFAGCRAQEALCMRVVDVWNGETHEIRRLVRLWQGEKGDTGTLILTAKAREACAAQIGALKAARAVLPEAERELPLDAYLIPSREGGYLSYERAWGIIKRLLGALQITDGQVATHSFRKTWVRWLLAGKWSTLAIKDAGRWRHIQSVEFYARHDPNELADRLEREEAERWIHEQAQPSPDRTGGPRTDDLPHGPTPVPADARSPLEQPPAASGDNPCGGNENGTGTCGVPAAG